MTSEEDRRFWKFSYLADDGLPVCGPSQVPREPVATLREAFNQTIRDPDFLRESAKMGLEVNPFSGERMQKLINEIFDLSPKLRKRLEIFK